MKQRHRGVLWFVFCLAVVAAAFGLSLRRGALFTSDWLAAQLPLHAAFAAALRSGSLALWSPLQYAGFPLLATGAVAGLYPPSLLLHALLPVTTALSALVLLHTLWAAAGAFLLARRLGARPALAAAAGTAFALGGLWLSPATGLNGGMAAAWLPWLLLLTDRLCARTSAAAREAGLLALALGWSLLAGGLAAWPGLLLTAAYALYLFAARKPGTAVLGWLALALGLAKLLYLPQFLPWREWTAWTETGASGAGLLAPLGQPPLWLPVVLILLAALLSRGLEWVLSRGQGRAPAALVSLALIAPLAAAYVLRLPPRQGLELERPRSVDFLLPQTGLYRLFTQERAGAVLAAQRESLTGSQAAFYGLPSASGGAGPRPWLYGRYIAGLTPNTLNLLGVKYYLIPQPHGEGGEDYDLNDPFTYDPMDKVAPTPIVMSSLVEIEWYLSDAAGLANGDPVALLTIVPEEMDEAQDFNLTAGSHVADWAYDRSDVRAAVRHSQARVVRTFPARSGNPPEDHIGYVYKAAIYLPYPTLTQGLWFTSRIDPARMHIERVVLTDLDGVHYVLSELEGKSDHVLAYRTEDVAIFENYDVLPRAFLAYRARAAADDDAALTLLRSQEFNPRQEALLAAAEVQPVAPPEEGAERVDVRSYANEQAVLEVDLPAPGYLVLTDAWYPGWQARVDGAAVPIERADVLFRAVYLEPGRHTVEFAYRPTSFLGGLAAAALALLAALLLALGWRRRQPAAQA